jgi:hypothetical protein
MRRLAVAVIVAWAAAAPLPACSLCAGLAGRQTLRQDLAQSKSAYLGTLSNPRLDPSATTGGGLTDFTVLAVVKADSAAARSRKSFTIARYVPSDPKAPAKYLVFCDEIAGQPDVYRGVPVASAALVDYLRGVAGIDAKKEPAKLLDHAGRHLDAADADVAAEAYLELALADDPDVLAAARGLDPARLRRLLDDPKTPAERLNLFAYLLGACGKPADAKQLVKWLKEPGERFRGALGGLYAGLVMIDPAEGWRELHATLGDPTRPFLERNAALSAVRFQRNANPAAFRAEVARAARLLLPQGDIADLIVEDLRRWQAWELAEDVLAVYGRPTHNAPLMKRAIVRFALCCPTPPARRFLAARRDAEAELVRDVEESLQFERGPKP